MSVNFISNYAAQVANRMLLDADKHVTSWLAKLSAGRRVLSAKDDAASLAVGSRQAAQIVGLKQASNNISQGISMLQIADGGLASISAILVRMKSLAVQAASDQNSTVERAMLDTEYAALRSEIDRVAQDTTFVDIQLLVNAGTSQQTAYSVSNIGNNVDADDGFDAYNFAIDANNISDGDRLSIEYDSGLGQMIVTNKDTGLSTSVAVVSTPLPGQTVDLLIATFDLTITLNDSFDPLTDNLGTGGPNRITISASSVNVAGPQILTFKVGADTAAADSITVTFGSAMAADLATGLETSTIASSSSANSATNLTETAINKVATLRAGIGANMNRFKFAFGNLSTFLENTEQARSALLDLDMAQAMSAFVSDGLRRDLAVSMSTNSNNTLRALFRLFRT